MFQEADISIILLEFYSIKLLTQHKSFMINSLLNLCLNITGDQGLMSRNDLSKP